MCIRDSSRRVRAFIRALTRAFIPSYELHTCIDRIFRWCSPGTHQLFIAIKVYAYIRKQVDKQRDRPFRVIKPWRARLLQLLCLLGLHVSRHIEICYHSRKSCAASYRVSPRPVAIDVSDFRLSVLLVGRMIPSVVLVAICCQRVRVNSTPQGARSGS